MSHRPRITASLFTGNEANSSEILHVHMKQEFCPLNRGVRTLWTPYLVRYCSNPGLQWSLLSKEITKSNWQGLIVPEPRDGALLLPMPRQLRQHPCTAGWERRKPARPALTRQAKQEQQHNVTSPQHLRFREEFALLEATNIAAEGIKRLPCQWSCELARSHRRLRAPGPGFT